MLTCAVRCCARSTARTHGRGGIRSSTRSRGSPESRTRRRVCCARRGILGEILHGLVISSPRPGGPDAIVNSGLMAVLGPPFMFGQGGPGGWWIVVEPELHLDVQ